MHFLPRFSAHRPAFRLLPVGGGPMGLVAALEETLLARSMGLPVEISIYEAGAFGGAPDHRAAAPRSQLWLHTGQLYAPTQPHVCLSVRESARRLQALC